MAYRYSIQSDRSLVVIVFEGDVTPAEEREALVAVTGDPSLNPDARILVDKTRSRMLVGPRDVDTQIDLARRSFRGTRKPRLAVAVSNDHDFGMMRMLELTSADDLPHELRVFRSVSEACAWLGVDPATIEWP